MSEPAVRKPAVTVGRGEEVRPATTEDLGRLENARDAFAPPASSRSSCLENALPASGTRLESLLPPREAASRTRLENAPPASSRSVLLPLLRAIADPPFDDGEPEHPPASRRFHLLTVGRGGEERPATTEELGRLENARDAWRSHEPVEPAPPEEPLVEPSPEKQRVLVEPAPVEPSPEEPSPEEPHLSRIAAQTLLEALPEGSLPDIREYFTPPLSRTSSTSPTFWSTLADLADLSLSGPRTLVSDGSDEVIAGPDNPMIFFDTICCTCESPLYSGGRPFRCLRCRPPHALCRRCFGARGGRVGAVNFVTCAHCPAGEPPPVQGYISVRNLLKEYLQECSAHRVAPSDNGGLGSGSLDLDGMD